MKLMKFSLVAFALIFSVQFAKAQSISIGASFGYRYPHHRVIVEGGYPGYAYYNQPVYYDRPVYYGRPYYGDRYYGRPVYYHAHRHYYRHW
jgi:hypothetical protein